MLIGFSRRHTQLYFFCSFVYCIKWYLVWKKWGKVREPLDYSVDFLLSLIYKNKLSLILHFVNKPWMFWKKYMTNVSSLSQSKAVDLFLRSERAALFRYSESWEVRVWAHSQLFFISEGYSLLLALLTTTCNIILL